MATDYFRSHNFKIDMLAFCQRGLRFPQYLHASTSLLSHCSYITKLTITSTNSKIPPPPSSVRSRSGHGGEDTGQEGELIGGQLLESGARGGEVCLLCVSGYTDTRPVCQPSAFHQRKGEKRVCVVGGKMHVCTLCPPTNMTNFYVFHTSPHLKCK